MNFNLLEECWIPVLVASGRTVYISPEQITQTDIPIWVNSPRPDFDAAVVQFLIGLLQTFFPPSDNETWRRYLHNPPTPQELRGSWESHRHVFNLLGEGPRFLQDFSKLGDGEEVSVEKLTLGNGTHYCHGGTILNLSLPCSAMALLSLQLNCPSLGRGYRVSIRGGGPLTTILKGKTLWETVWFSIA